MTRMVSGNKEHFVKSRWMPGFTHPNPEFDPPAGEENGLRRLKKRDALWNKA